MDSELEPAGRSLLDLLSLNYIFLQHPLLSVKEFADACERRGLDISSMLAPCQFEALHKAGILIPVYRVALNLRTIRKMAQEMNYPIWRVGDEITARRLITSPDPAVGRVYDPRTEPFRPWNRFKRQADGIHFHTSYYFYSPYQLFLIPILKRLLPLMKIRRLHDLDFQCKLSLTERKAAELLEDRCINDNLVVLLSALDRLYRPKITRRISGIGDIDEWHVFEELFNPVEILSWLDWEATKVCDEAEKLIYQAGFIDPLNDWLPLVRLCRPEQWQRLKGDALLAVDYRMAGEILLRFYEDLVSKDAAPPLPTIPRYANHAFKERIKPERDALDSVLMDFGLSPHPSLLLFLEGETEMEIVPLVLSHLSMRWPRNFVEIHNAKTGQANLGRLASRITPLVFGEEHGDFIEIARPAARVLGVFDKEGIHRTPESSEQARIKWVDEFFDALPEKHKTLDMRTAIDSLFEVYTWEDGSFEFAHFTDEELYEGLVSYCMRLNIPVGKIEISKIANARSLKGNIKKFFPENVKAHLKKPAFAREMWPTLAKKIDAAIAEGDPERVPIVKVLGRALDRAMTVHRWNVVMPVKGSPTSSLQEEASEAMPASDSRDNEG